MADSNPIVSAIPNNPTPPMIVHQDNSAFPSSILNETNYPLWSQLIEMRIGARNKARYLTGKTKKPAPEDHSHTTWITENHRVKSWLIDSMSQSLMRGLFASPQPRKYGRLKLITKTTSQEGTFEGVVQLHSAMTRLRVHIFLSKLDSEFNQVHGEILRKDPKLDLESTYAYVRKEHQQRQTMKGSQPMSESSAMLANQSLQGSSSGSTKNRNNQSTGRPNNFVCSHCGETSHSKQQCYEIIGYPGWWDFSKKPRKKVARKATVTSTEEVQPNVEENSQVTANVAHQCTVGASDHMTRDSGRLQSVHLSPQSHILTRKILGYGVKRGKLYYLELTESGGQNSSMRIKLIVKKTLKWHMGMDAMIHELKSYT
ncbi:hypothetical protein RJ640_015795 [Escallonia rubra]|uniref:Retrotransposon Copia-like N-terminal domain-containing protein n=1 Tax=Escallonia rubra TaxID=112253 RepID=A0AA88UAD8_9ASTE|nr:hypothetical protein RJ640_015795 [Escallonia rubra]